MQYTASSFAAPLLAAYRGASPGSRTHAPRRRSRRTRRPGPRLARSLPAWHGVSRAARLLRPLQRGRLSLYLLYVVGALAATLGYLMLAGRAP